MSYLKLEQLRYLSEAVKYNSISIAAEKNFISQPSFSAAITKLEKELNVTLLRRNSRGVKPTETGEAILAKAYDIFERLNEINDIASQHNNQGIVHIATIPCICDQILPIALKKINNQQNAVIVSINCAESNEVYHQVLSGMCALGILFHSIEIAHPEICYTNLFEDEYVLYVGPASPYWDAESITIEEAFAQPYIAYREEFIKNNGGVTDKFPTMTPNIVLRTDDNESIKKMINEGNYVAFFHRMMTKNDIYLKYGLVRALTISNYDTRVRVGYIESTKYKPSSVDRIFISALKDAIEDFFKNV